MREKSFDLKRKFVRVLELRTDGFVEFEFAIGEPELCVEMILPSEAFDEFCTMNKVTIIDGSSRLEASGEGGADWAWSLRDATHQRFR